MSISKKQIIILAGLLLAGLQISLSAAFASPMSKSELSVDSASTTSQANQATVLLYWASWCGYCKTSLQQADNFVDEDSEALSDYSLVTVNYRDNVNPVLFLRDLNVDLPSADAAEYPLANQQVKVLPWMVIVDDKGQVIADGKPQATAEATLKWIRAMVDMHAYLAFKQ